MNANPSTHVLVVDDQSGFRELLKRMLEPAGYEVRTATDAHEAIISIAESPPAVAVLDVHMPGPNGLWLANRIRTRSPKTAIVLATSDDTVPPVESLRKGVVAYIVKPLQRDAVLMAVSDAFKWFAAESGVDLARLGVPTHARTSPDRVEPVVADSDSGPPVLQRTSSLRISMRPVLIVAVVTAAALVALYRQRTPVRAVDRVAAASGTVMVEDGAGKPFMQGSGFFINADTFVTSHHVIDGGTRAKITMATSGLVLQVTGLVAFDRQHDLALLKTSEPAGSHLNLNAAVPAVGDNIFVYGAPRGLEGTLSEGIISAHRAERNLLQISAPISPGSSGSPVANSEGDVVGVVAGARLDGQGLNFAIPAAYVLDLLSSARTAGPLIAAGRGAGNDLERHELIGPVRSATVFASDPVSSERSAIGNLRTTLLFDREGRLLERTGGDGITTRYEYDELGRLRTEIDTKGDQALKRWDFTAVGTNAVEAVVKDSTGPTRRRIEYMDDGRVVADETRTAERLVTSTRWTYDSIRWPIRLRVHAGAHASNTETIAAREEHDAVGNPIRRMAVDGTELTFGYRFDARGNWLSRETTRVDASGTRNVISHERREIQYW
jgi:YD repeat-containing protein